MKDEPAQKVIVLADDDLFIEHAYKTGLEEAGFVVVVAPDGEEALTQVRTLKPSLVLMELILPKLDGFSVITELKSDPATADVPILVLTNLSQQSDMDEARRLGAVDCLTKSEVALHDVLVRIEQVLAAK